MVQALIEKGASVELHYGAESDDAFAYLDELKAFLGDRLTLYRDDQGERPDLSTVFSGLPEEAELYMCGPLPMLDAAKSAWSAAGRPISRLRYEVFGDSGMHAERPFEVEIKGRPETVVVPENKTLLGALQDAGIDMIYDCQRGECGLCAVNLVDADGPIDHRDVFFSDDEKAEGKKMCACVSRLVGGKAVIDIGYRP